MSLILDICLEKFAGKLTGYDIDQIKALAQNHMESGLGAVEADQTAVKDYINDLAGERDDIIGQVTSQAEAIKKADIEAKETAFTEAEKGLKKAQLKVLEIETAPKNDRPEIVSKREKQLSDAEKNLAEAKELHKTTKAELDNVKPAEPVTAKFIGYQEDAKGGQAALYNVVGGELNNSTVTAKTLTENGIEVPETLPVEPKVLYRGSSKEGGEWFTPDKNAAKEYSELDEGGKVSKLTIDLNSKKIAEPSNIISAAKKLGIDTEAESLYALVSSEYKDVVSELKNQGFDGVHLPVGEDFAPSGKAIESYRIFEKPKAKEQTEVSGIKDLKNFWEIPLSEAKEKIPPKTHRAMVEQALSENKPVPESVLKDYPELQERAETETKKQKSKSVRFEAGRKLTKDERAEVMRSIASVDIIDTPQPITPEPFNKKPILTQEQQKRRLKAKEVKEKQINIADAKEAGEYIRKGIIGRRKALNLSSYETNLFVNEIEKVTNKAQRETIPFIVEGTDVPKELNRPDIEKVYSKNKKDLDPIAKQVKKHFDDGWQKMKMHIPDMSAEQVENYVTHIWDLNEGKKREVTNWFITQNRFLKKRYIETLKEGVEKFGLKPRTLDIGDIIRIHDGTMNRAIENKKFVDDLIKIKKDGVPLIERADKAPHGWILYDHPALRRALVIPGDPKMGEKISPALKSILDEMGVAIGRRISPTIFGKPNRLAGQYRHGDPPEVRFQRFMSNKTIAHEIGHHLDVTLGLGENFLNNYKSELYAINRNRIELSKKDPGKYGEKYTSSPEEQIAEFFATVFTDADKAYQLAPNATVDVLERLKNNGTLTRLVDFDFEKSAKNLIEEQLNMLVKLPVKVHPDIKKPLDVIFGSKIHHPIIQGYEMANGILKKSVLSLSLFHHAALGETGIATMGLARTANIMFNPVKIYKALAKGEFDIYERQDIAKKWIGSGLQVGATSDIPVNLIQDKLNDIARKSKDVPVVSKVTDLIATFNQAWDRALWDYLHDNLKLYAAEHLGTKIDAFGDIEKQKTEIAQFVNDTFGGQNWDMLMVNPKTLQIMSWGLLSSDWTTSTIRQALSPTGIGKIHKETRALRKKLGNHFWLKAGLYFGVGINVLNYTFRKWDEKDNPQYYKDKDMKFIDYTMWGNTIGKRTNLFVGRYEDGTERYVRWGKQFRELFEFFYDESGFNPIVAPLKKIGGKLSPALQLVSQIFTGVAPSGFRNDDIYGKKGWDRAQGIFKTLIKSPIPFASRNLLSDDKEFHVTDIAFPSSKGMTRYKSIELFKHAILGKDERLLKEIYQDTLKNNLPAFTLFNAALTSLKAETTKELNKSIKTIKDLNEALKTTKSTEDVKRLERRLMRFKKESDDRKAGIRAYGIALKQMKKYNQEAP